MILRQSVLGTNRSKFLAFAACLGSSGLFFSCGNVPFNILSNALTFNFMAGNLPAGLAFSRITPGTYFDSGGILRSAGSGVPRFEYDPISHVLKGLLMERNSANLLFYSADFTQAGQWTLSQASATASSQVAPDGTVAGSVLQEDATLNAHSVSQASAYTGGVWVTYSVFVKASGRSAVRLQLVDGAGPGGLSGDFDLATLSVSGFRVTGGSAVLGSSGIQNGGGGWYRCWYSGIVSTSNTTLNAQVVLLSSAGGASNYTGNGTSGLLLWGAQLEANLAVPTSYIATGVVNGIARSSDGVAVSGFSGWYNPDAWTAVMSFSRPSYEPVAQVVYPVLWQFFNSNSPNADQITTDFSPGGPDFISNWFVGSSLVTGLTSQVVINVSDQLHRLAVSKTAGSATLVLDGGAPVTGALPSVPTVDTLNLGGTSHGPGDGLNGHLKNFSYWKGSAPAAQLRMVTGL